MRKPRDSDQYLSDQGYKEFLRKHAHSPRVQRKKSTTAVSLSTPISLLYERRLTEIFKPHQHIVDIVIPRNFSIIDNPQDALKVICSFSNTVREFDHRIKEVSIDYGNMQEVDLAAESILDFLFLERQREQRNRRKKTNFRGHYPKDAKLKRYLKAVGIIKNLDIKHEFLAKEEEARLRIFRMRSKKTLRPANAGSSDFKEQVVRDFVDHINVCLNDHKRQLTDMARSKLAQYTGEVLGNAEEHSGYNDWSIVGYLDNAHESHMCEIAMFNFGKTISETFRELPKNSYAYSVIEPYIDAHKSRWFKQSWTVDDLITLVALQGHVSSKNKSPEDDRGQGTVDLIEIFQRVHQECIKDEKPCAAMAILSGYTHILFDGTYKMQADTRGRKVIAFNKGNDLNDPPDEKYVKNLDKLYFPGVIISIRFPMAASQTREVERI